METKQKTWEDCCDEVAKDNGWDDWECVLISKMSLESKSILTKKAAELFNQETAAERDRLKEQLLQCVSLNSERALEIDSLKEENERLKADLQKFVDTSLQKAVELDSLKQLNSELLKLAESAKDFIETNHGVQPVDNYFIYREAKRLISKASDGYTKAKD